MNTRDMLLSLMQVMKSKTGKEHQKKAAKQLQSFDPEKMMASLSVVALVEDGRVVLHTVVAGNPIQLEIMGVVLNEVLESVGDEEKTKNFLDSLGPFLDPRTSAETINTKTGEITDHVKNHEESKQECDCVNCRTRREILSDIRNESIH